MLAKWEFIKANQSKDRDLPWKEMKLDYLLHNIQEDI